MAYYTTIQRVIKAELWNGENEEAIKDILGNSFIERAGNMIVYVPAPATQGSLVKMTRYLPIGWYIFTEDDIRYEKMRADDFDEHYKAYSRKDKGDKK